MADIDRMTINGTTYDLSDLVARALIEALQNEDFVSVTDIINNLTSTSTTAPLSANQGNQLNISKIDNVTMSGNTVNFMANGAVRCSITLPTSSSGDGLTAEQLTQLTTAYNHSQTTHAPSNAEANVQSDWNVTNTNSDAYIANKPTNVSEFTNDANYATETYVNDAIGNIGASNITVADTANNFTATNVEGVLAELIARIVALENNQGSTGGGDTGGDTHTYTSGFATALYNATTWQVFGDSISTTYNISENQIWHNLITADSEFSSMTKYNNSLTGSEISDGGRSINSFIERYTSLNSNADLVTIFGGVNDWSHNYIPLGNYDDATTSQSFYGALNTLLPGIKTQCPNARVIFMSPLKVSDTAFSNYITNGLNTYGLTLQDYIQAIKYKCHQYNIEFVDLYEVTGLDPNINTSNFQSDGVHPTANGHIALRDYLLNTATVSVPTDEYSSETITYTITNNLTNVTNSNSAVSIVANSSYTATITANSGYNLDSITVTMGGTNITSSVVSGGIISISNVTGNIVITASATATSSGGGSIPSNTVTVESLHGNNHFNLFYAIDASNLNSGDTVVVSWAYSNGSITPTSLNNSSSFYSNSYENAIRTSTSDGCAGGYRITQAGNFASGTSTMTVGENSNNYPYFLAMTSFGALSTSSLPITWDIDSLSVTVNGVEVPILGAGGFFTDESIIVDYEFYTSRFATALSNTTIWQVFGDSISTTYNISENQIWHNLITADSEFSSITKYNNSLTGSEVSDGGRSIDSFIERYTSLNSNATLVTIFAGVNDWAHNNIPLGNYNDVTTQNSFYGALNTLLPGVKAQCPNARVIWLSPLKTRSGMAVESTNTDGTNAFGLYLTDYIQAIKYKCHQYNVEFVDLYGVTGLDPDVNTGNFASDGLHPNASGHIALRDYLLNTATVSVPSDEYGNEGDTGGGDAPGGDTATNTVTVESLHGNNHFNLFYAIDASNLNNGDTVVVSWTYSNASTTPNSFNGSASFYSESYENAIRTNTTTGVAGGYDISQSGSFTNGTSTTVVGNNDNSYPYFLAMTSFGALSTGSLPITWDINNISVTVNGVEVPILGAGGFFTDESIIVDYEFDTSSGGDTGNYVTEGLSLYLNSNNSSNTTTTLADMSGNGNDFTSAVNITTNEAGRIVLGGSQYFSNTSYAPHTTTDNDFTFEFFGDIESTGGRNYFFSYGSRNGFSWDEQYGLSGQMGTGDIIWTGTDTVNGYANRIAPTFGERHVIITKNGTTYSIYVDGALVSNQTYTTSWSGTYTNFRLFIRYNDSNILNGTMKYVRWYTKGFTANEVTQNYNSRNN